MPGQEKHDQGQERVDPEIGKTGQEAVTQGNQQSPAVVDPQ